jgi:hypothetical protein
MTESQQKVLELLPKMGERFPKVFTKESFVPFFWEVKLGESKNVVANAGQVFDYGPALIVEACRLTALEAGWGMICADYPVVEHGLPSVRCAKSHIYSHHEYGDEYEIVETNHIDYNPQDPFARAAAAMECVLSLP